MIGRAEKAARLIWPVLSLALVLVVLAALLSLGPMPLQRTATEAFIRLIVVIGLYIFIGTQESSRSAT